MGFVIEFRNLYEAKHVLNDSMLKNDRGHVLKIYPLY
jgi:hypothetical protein